MAVLSLRFTSSTGGEFTVSPCRPTPGILAILTLAKYARTLYPVLQAYGERADRDYARLGVEILSALQPVVEPQEIVQWLSLVSGIPVDSIESGMTFADLIPLAVAVARTNDILGMLTASVSDFAASISSSIPPPIPETAAPLP